MIEIKLFIFAQIECHLLKAQFQSSLCTHSSTIQLILVVLILIPVIFIFTTAIVVVLIITTIIVYYSKFSIKLLSKRRAK